MTARAMEPALAMAEEHADPFPFHQDPWWRKTIILAAIVIPLAAFAGVVVAGWGSLLGVPEAVAFVVLWSLAGFGVTLGYHRMTAHHAFVAKPPTRYALLILGSLSLQGPPADWAATHIRHHAKADRDGDPHSPLDGFWHAHFGWLLRDRFVRTGLVHRKLLRDPATRFVQRTWLVWAVAGFLLPGVIALAIGGRGHFWSGVLWGGVLRVMVTHHVTWSVNSVTHMLGTRPFRTPDQARNNVLVALLSWGEGWHNNHHAFPNSAFMGHRWWQVDFGAWVLRLLKAMGQIEQWHRPTVEERAQRRS